ncbi:MAG: hypothetical protein GY805_22015 [Chloroflexi bacterium]|nr:hypothetical protein [Chloroflexota bacterium]
MKRLPFSVLMFSMITLLFQACASSTESESEPTSLPGNGRSQPIPIEEYVRQAFIGGVPYEEVSANYDETSVPALLEMLNDPAEEAHWANIVVVLNIIGNEDVVDPIIAFINSEVEGELSRPHYTAKTSALMSLGYLIHRTESEEALNYLIDSLEPVMWEKRGTTGISPFQNSLEESHMELSKHAILGLALSGNSKAAAALRAFQESATEDSPENFEARMIDIIPEALATNEEIANIGLVDYYRNTQP